MFGGQKAEVGRGRGGETKMEEMRKVQVEEVVSHARRLGIVVGEASATEFLFVAEREVPRWEYVSVFSVEETLPHFRT